MNNKDLKILALIPARSGSKRIKDKNIRPLDGKPLIAHTIESALKSRYINKVIVSTDSEKIADISKEHGAECPFLRPADIAGDHSVEISYYIHALNWLAENEHYIPDIIVNLYVTSPFRKTETIDQAIEKFLAHSDADSLRSVKKCSEHPYKMWYFLGDYLEPLIPTQNTNVHTFSSQMFPEYYIQNASIYITRPETIKKYNSVIGNTVIGFQMSEEESFDINTELDFSLAENLLSSPQNNDINENKHENKDAYTPRW